MKECKLEKKKIYSGIGYGTYGGRYRYIRDTDVLSASQEV